MLEILPIKLLCDEDAPLFGSINVALGKLLRLSFPVADGFVASPPEIHLSTNLQRLDFSSKEVFQQSLTILKKQVKDIPLPEELKQEVCKHERYLVQSKEIKGIKNLWSYLMDCWVGQITNRLWANGFHKGITKGLQPVQVTFIKKPSSLVVAYFDELQDDVHVACKFGKLQPAAVKKIVDAVLAGNKKLFLPYEYEWVVDDKLLKLTRLMPYTPPVQSSIGTIVIGSRARPCEAKAKSAVKIIADLSDGLIPEKNIDGVYISSEKLYDLNLPNKSFEQLIARVIESSVIFNGMPVYFKLADKSENLPSGRQRMGGLRGAIRLIHQQSLLNPLLDALDFIRNKKSMVNIHIVVPFLRNVSELRNIKQQLAGKNLKRGDSLQMLMEAGVPENILNLEEYLEVGIDGIVLNLDELVSYLNGFDYGEESLGFYKNNVEALFKFLEDPIRLIHKLKLPFIASGSLTLNQSVLEYLVEKGVYGLVVERFHAHGAKELLNQTEKRVISRRISANL